MFRLISSTVHSSSLSLADLCCSGRATWLQQQALNRQDDASVTGCSEQPANSPSQLKSQLELVNLPINYN